MTTFARPQPCKAKRCVHSVRMADPCAKCERLLAAYRLDWALVVTHV